MKRLIARMCLLSACTLWADTGMAAPTPQAMIPSPPQLSARSWVLMEAATGHVIAQHDSSERLPPASLTKLIKERGKPPSFRWGKDSVAGKAGLVFSVSPDFRCIA